MEANCSLTNSSFNTEHEVERMINVVTTRQSNIDKASKKRSVVGEHKTASSQKPNKKVKLDPMHGSLKDRIAELSKITSEQQKLFDNLLQDQDFVDQLDKPDELSQSCDSVHNSALMPVASSSDMVEDLPQPEPPLSVSEKITRPLIEEECQNMKEVISLVDIVIEEAPSAATSSSSMPFIFCDDDKEEEEEPIEKVPRKRRRNSLIPKKASSDDKKPLTEQTAAPLAARNTNNNSTVTDKVEGRGGLLSKVLKKVPMTRATKKRMSIAGSQMTENQPISAVPASGSKKEDKKEVLRPLRSSTRRSSTSVVTHRGLRNL